MDTTVQVATQPTASEFRGGIIGVTLRPVSGADLFSLITEPATIGRVVKVADRTRSGFAPVWVRFPLYLNAKFITQIHLGWTIDGRSKKGRFKHTLYFGTLHSYLTSAYACA